MLATASAQWYNLYSAPCFSSQNVFQEMFRPITISALSSIFLFIAMPRVDAGLMTNATAFSSSGSFGATAAHGFLKGNDTGSGDPLLTLLRSGTSTGVTAVYVEHIVLGKKKSVIETPIRISSTGMFSTATNQLLTHLSNPIVDVISSKKGFDGYRLGSNQQWNFLGKSDDNPSFAFSSADHGKKGTILLNTPPAPLNGPFVLSLKAGNEYSVYLFQTAVGILRFEFDLPHSGLSHASLFQVGSNGFGAVPEPASMAVFGFGALLGLGGLRRRHKVTKRNCGI